MRQEERLAPVRHFYAMLDVGLRVRLCNRKPTSRGVDWEWASNVDRLLCRISSRQCANGDYPLRSHALLDACLFVRKARRHGQSPVCSLCHRPSTSHTWPTRGQYHSSARHTANETREPSHCRRAVIVVFLKKMAANRQTAGHLAAHEPGDDVQGSCSSSFSDVPLDGLSSRQSSCTLCSISERFRLILIRPHRRRLAGPPHLPPRSHQRARQQLACFRRPASP